MRGDDDAVVNATPYLVRDDSLRGVPVFSISGKKLGALEGVVVSKNHGAIAYAVLSCTSLMGLRKKRYILRHDALTLDAERRRLRRPRPLRRFRSADEKAGARGRSRRRRVSARSRPVGLDRPGTWSPGGDTMSVTIEFSTSRYERLHGRKPRGYGLWYFRMPDGRTFVHPGSYYVCRRAVEA